HRRPEVAHILPIEPAGRLGSDTAPTQPLPSCSDPVSAAAIVHEGTMTSTSRGMTSSSPFSARTKGEVPLQLPIPSAPITFLTNTNTTTTTTTAQCRCDT
ncbi:hypothetical protein Vafri_5741, partial [Volvox africanus]